MQVTISRGGEHGVTHDIVQNNNNNNDKDIIVQQIGEHYSNTTIFV